MAPRQPKDSRPRIWSDGSQHPPFAPRAFALASVRFARDSLSGLLSRCSESARGFGTEMAEGRWRVPPERLGRSGQYLPSSSTAARAVRSGADVLSRAARVVLAEPEPQPVTPPVDMSTWRAPQAETTAPRRIERSAMPADDTDLAAIRALLRDEPAQNQRSRPVVAPTAAPRPAAPAAAESYAWRREWLAEKSGLMLGYGLLVVSVPVGIVMAAIAHIKGEDLRKIVGEE